MKPAVDNLSVQDLSVANPSVEGPCNGAPSINRFSIDRVSSVRAAPARAAPARPARPARFAAALAALSLSVAAAASELAQGEVRRIDRAAGKVTLRHGEIVRLGMPPMTMVFQVRDPAVLEGLKPGDRIRFDAEQSGGTYVIIKVEPAR